MAGVALCVPIANKLGKKTTFIIVNATLLVLSIAFFFVPCTPSGFWTMLVLQVIISIFTGVMSPLIWSMYADVSDYAELEFHTASTGLIFSSASMAQKVVPLVVRPYSGCFLALAIMPMHLQQQTLFSRRVPF